MSGIAVLGAGAFGTALAISLARARADVVLWGRDAEAVAGMSTSRRNTARLPGATLPDGLQVTADLPQACNADVLLLSLPMQRLADFLGENADLLAGKQLVACCKGVDLESGRLAHQVIARAVPDATPALLSGPSFADDIAQGLPTALTLAADDPARLQHILSTPNLRLYSSADLTGVAIGGALKNVIAIACGTAMGAGLGESARAALMTRGFAEMVRYAEAVGADAETLAGLSGFGDLALTCTSEKSRNYRFGLRLGETGGVTETETTEGIATAQALMAHPAAKGLDMPITSVVARMTQGDITVADAIDALLSRPLKPE